MQTPPSLDEEALAKLLRLGGTRLVGNMVDLFLDFAPTKITEARAAEQKGDWRGVADATHPLRTSAGHVGALLMQALAVEIETLARAGEHTVIPARIAAIADAFAEIQPRLREKSTALASGARG